MSCFLFMGQKLKLFVCTKGKHCKKRGAKKILCALLDSLETFGLEDKVCLKKSDCLGKCGRGPAVQVMPRDEYYGNFEADDCEDFVKALKKKGKPPKGLLLGH
ncbi:MAG: (2Fe-2S) ferredoxin domain-containing protein [Candidatus Obscuribacterales bacterium]|nr:(2Fe-2S) ferredoxin domain-containing protein [Candidatus Obscuribacterales bacterium]